MFYLQPHSALVDSHLPTHKGIFWTMVLGPSNENYRGGEVLEQDLGMLQPIIIVFSSCILCVLSLSSAAIFNITDLCYQYYVNGVCCIW